MREREREMNVDRLPGRKRESEMGQKRETGEHEMKDDKRTHGGEGLKKKLK